MTMMRRVAAVASTKYVCAELDVGNDIGYAAR